MAHICKGWKLTHWKFFTRLFTSIQKCVVLWMLSNNPSCNVIWCWSFMLALNKLEQYLQLYFKKWGNRVKFWLWELDGLIISLRRGWLEPCFSWSGGGGGGYSRELIPICTLCYMKCFSSFIKLSYTLWKNNEIPFSGSENNRQ